MGESALFVCRVECYDGTSFSTARAASAQHERSGCVGRPRLEKRWLGLRYQAVFADEEGRLSTVAFRRLPPELALTEGERFTIVFHARRARPKYAILHGPHLDVGWRVR